MSLRTRRGGRPPSARFAPEPPEPSAPHDDAADDENTAPLNEDAMMPPSDQPNTARASACAPSQKKKRFDPLGMTKAQERYANPTTKNYLLNSRAPKTCTKK